jgi:hypothetical protein
MNDWLEKIAQVDPLALSRVKLAYSMLRTSPFREETEEEIALLVKKAQAPSSAMGPFFRGVGATVAQGALLNLAGEVYQKLRHGVTKGINYRRMVKEYRKTPPMGGLERPSLSEEELRKLYSTLHRFNPTAAADPYIASEMVKQLATNAGSQDVGDLVGSYNTLTAAQRLPVHRLSMDPREQVQESSLRAAQIAQTKARTDQATTELNEARQSVKDVASQLKKMQLDMRAREQSADVRAEELRNRARRMSGRAGHPKTASAPRFLKTPLGVRFVGGPQLSRSQG